MAQEIVDFPIENGGSFYSYVSLPEGISWFMNPINNSSKYHKPMILYNSNINHQPETRLPIKSHSTTIFLRFS